MLFSGIALYSLRAAAFALPVCAVYALALRGRKRKATWAGLACVFYFAALFEITVLRGGIEWDAFFNAPRAMVQWVPLKTTLAELRRGAWPFTYHMTGNLAWFVPLGFFARKKPAWFALAAGALLSASIEAAQWALMTGQPDVDDLLLNAAGAFLGRLAAGLLAMRPRGRGE
jgi:glycopeptide antibiotics resistance protein